jgi:hypothetical protein
MALSLTKLRINLFKVVDHIIETGQAVEIERKGQRLIIIPTKPKNKLDNLVLHPDFIKGSPDDIVHMDWTTNWSEEKNL